mgnify:FL=1
MSKESTATIKLASSEIDSNILALLVAKKNAEMHNQLDSAKAYDKLHEDFCKIRDSIIEAENNNG